LPALVRPFVAKRCGLYWGGSPFSAHGALPFRRFVM